MPVVSEEYRQRRREQILAAARACFVRNGFHQTSMDDLLAEAGLSAGAFYRYFRSKDEIIAAIAEESLASLRSAVDAVVREPSPPSLAGMLRRVLEVVDRLAAPGGQGQLALQVWSEAQRDEQVAALVRTEVSAFREQALALARHAQATGRLPVDLPVEPMGRALFALVIGYLVQKVLLGEADVDGFVAGFEALVAAHR